MTVDCSFQAGKRGVGRRETAAKAAWGRGGDFAPSKYRRGGFSIIFFDKGRSLGRTVSWGDRTATTPKRELISTR